MKDLERIQEEIITIIVLIITLTFTSCNLTPESSKNQSLAQRLLFTEMINY